MNVFKEYFFDIRFLALVLGLNLPVYAAHDIQEVNSSVGKSPYLLLASATNGFEPVDPSSLGKPASVMVFEGPAPHGSIAPNVRFSAKHFYYIYADHKSKFNHFKPIGYMGDVDDIQVDENSQEDPADGLTCIKISYLAIGLQGHEWAGVYWLDPHLNWGYKETGYNLSGMKRLTFWARGLKGGEQIALFKVGGVQGSHADSGTAKIGPVWLTKEWQQYVIDLHDVDLSKISGAFAWSASRTDNLEAITFYLDEIRFER